MSEEIKLPEIEGLSEKEIEDNSVASLRSIPGRSSAFGAPQKTAKEVQEAFDALPKLVAGKVNEIINAYNALVAAAKAIDDKADDIAGDLAEEAAARNQAIADEAQARETAVSAEAQARDSAVKAESVARAAAIAALKAELLGGASDAYNTLKELEDALKNGDSDVAAILAAISAVEASLAGKVDTKDVSTTATTDTIAKRISGGRLAVGRAAADGDAVPYKQMREELERYLADGGGIPPDLLDGITKAIKMIDTLEAKVANLEAGLAPDVFVVDDATAYVKTIPTDAAPYAEIRAVGGMTHKIAKYGNNLLNTNFANNSDPEVSADGDTIYLNYMSYGWSAWFSDLFLGLVIGKQYILTASAYGGDLAPATLDTGGVPLDTPFTLTETHLSESFYFQPGYADDGAAGQPCGGTFVVILREVTDVLVDTPVTALAIKDASGNVTNAFAIPAAVQALDGYGKTDHRIEWDEDGKAWWVTPNARTDISQYFTEDNLIPVEAGGTITAVNEHGLAAPTTIVYQATGQSIADAFDEVHEYAQSILNGG